MAENFDAREPGQNVTIKRGDDLPHALTRAPIVDGPVSTTTSIGPLTSSGAERLPAFSGGETEVVEGEKSSGMPTFDLIRGDTTEQNEINATTLSTSEIPLELAKVHSPVIGKQFKDGHEESSELHHGERIRLGEHILSEEDSLIVEEGTSFYIDGLNSRIAQAEQAIQDAEIHATAESHAITLTTKGIEWLQKVSEKELPDDILTSPGIHQAYERVASLKNLISRVQAGNSDAMREVKSVIPRTSKFAKTATKLVQIEEGLHEQLVSAEEQAMVLSGDKPLDEREPDSSAEAVYDEFAQGLMGFLGTEEAAALDTNSLDMASVGRLVRLAAIDKLDYDLLQQKMRAVLEQKIKDATNNNFDVEKQKIALLNGLYSDPTLAGSRARQQVHAQGLDIRLLDLCQHVLQTGGRDGEYWRSMTASLLQEGVKTSETNFIRATLPGDTVLEHYSPLSVEVLRHGALAPKTEHYMSNTNEGSASNQIHFTSMSEVPSGRAMDYGLRYAVQKNSVLNSKLLHDPKLEHLPGVFTLSLSDAIKKGKNCVLATLKKVHGRDVPEDFVLAEHDGSPTRFDIDDMQFAPILDSDPSGIKDIWGFNKYAQRRNKKLDEVRSTWDKKTPWQEHVAANYDPIVVLKDYLLEGGIDPDWVRHNVVRDTKEAREKSRSETKSSVVIPLARVRETKFLPETVDKKGEDSLRLPLMFMGVGEAA